MMFSEMFLKQRSFEVDYKGKKINSFYSLKKVGTYKLKFNIISKSSNFDQAIEFHLSEFEGEITYNGEKKSYGSKKRRFPQIAFPCKEFPNQFELEVSHKTGYIAICNASDPLGTGEFWHSMVFNCAMIIEKLSDNKFRFHCNDHEYDDDFDDLIFEMEIIDC